MRLPKWIRMRPPLGDAEKDRCPVSGADFHGDSEGTFRSHWSTFLPAKGEALEYLAELHRAETDGGKKDELKFLGRFAADPKVWRCLNKGSPNFAG
jgi:hypothetical protein